MRVTFRVLYCCAALLSMASGLLVVASLFIEDRAPQSNEMLGVHIAVAVTFLGIGGLLLGIQRNVAAIAGVVNGQDGETAQQLAGPVNRLLLYLIAGGAFLCAVLGLSTYAILARIDQGFAVFG